MGIWSQEVFEVVCDGDGCTESCRGGDPFSSEDSAIRAAEEDGWACVDGKWYCGDCQAETAGRG